jgi:hypothetical protein
LKGTLPLHRNFISGVAWRAKFCAKDIRSSG